MCNIVAKYSGKKKSITGYKIAYKKRNKYYSCFTKIEYKEGPVQGVNNVDGIRYEYSPSWNNHRYYDEKYYGGTSVMLYKDDIDSWIRTFRCIPKYKFVILKVTISNNLHYSSQSLLVKDIAFCEAMWGMNIDKIEEIEEL